MIARRAFLAFTSLLGGAAMLLFTSSEAIAACSTSICVGAGSSCTISGSNTVDDPCILDFGTKDVTITGTVQSVNTCGGTIEIIANSVTLSGTLRAICGDLTVTTTGNFTMQTGGRVNVNGTDGTDAGTATVDAGGNITVAGSGITADGGGTGSYGGTIDLTAAGTLTTTGPLLGTGAGGGTTGATITMVAAGAAQVDGSVTSNGGGTDGAGGEISLEAASVTTAGNWTANSPTAGWGASISITATNGNVETTGSITATGTGGGDGGAVNIAATKSDGTGNVTIGGNITTTSNGDGASGGDVAIDADVNGTVTLQSGRTIRTECTTSNCLFDGDATLTGCSLVVDGTIDVHQTDPDVGGGEATFRYRSSFTCTGGVIQADTTFGGGNFIQCRCVDTSPEDGTCDSASCAASAPSGCSFSPATTTSPIWQGPCVGCHNGVVQAGESCDDGNFTNCDTCDNSCKTGCGSGAVCGGEQCDDGNTSNGDCCSSTCQFESSGSACATDGNECTDDVCNGLGSCTHPGSASGTPCTADSNECTDDVCNGSGSCTHPGTASGTPCTADSNSCTKDECDGSGNCGHPCDNGKPCELPCPIASTCGVVNGNCICQ